MLMRPGESRSRLLAQRVVVIVDRSDANALLITGAFGTGKTSMVEESPTSWKTEASGTARSTRHRRGSGLGRGVHTLRTTHGMPLTVVRLTVPIDEIERRLSNSITAARADDLQVARHWGLRVAAKGRRPGDRERPPIREVAVEVLTALGW